MKKHLLSLLLLLAFLPCSAQIEQVILIGVDGLGSFGLKRNNTPVMDSIMKAGAYSLKAKAVYPSLSSPNWASIIMGVSPKEHKIKSNDWRRRHIAHKTFCNGGFGETYPTIFKVVSQYNPSGRNIASFNHWQEFERLIEPDIPVQIRHFSSEDTVVNKALKYFTKNKPKLTFIHLDQVDKAGHHYGLRSKEYSEAVQKADTLIGKILTTLQKSELVKSTVVVITSDHGFRGKHHGGIGRKLRRVPWLVIGPRIKKGYKIKAKVDVYDTAPTITSLLRIKPPECWEGRFIGEILK